jgi:phosphate starvation-inducible PhoH-like protein
MKTFISRLGENSKMVICGDPEQCDIKLNRGELNGLVDAMNRFKDLDGVGIVEFTEDDIVRDPFLIQIMKRYKN